MVGEEIIQSIEDGCPVLLNAAKEEGVEELFYKTKVEFLNLVEEFL